MVRIFVSILGQSPVHPRSLSRKELVASFACWTGTAVFQRPDIETPTFMLEVRTTFLSQLALDVDRERIVLWWTSMLSSPRRALCDAVSLPLPSSCRAFASSPCLKPLPDFAARRVTTRRGMYRPSLAMAGRSKLEGEAVRLHWIQVDCCKAAARCSDHPRGLYRSSDTSSIVILTRLRCCCVAPLS
jgi:hypothetical protein